jgi:hypothetical protein
MTDPAKPPFSFWPLSITAALVAVVLGLGYVAYIAISNPAHLVRPDYYDAEIAHEDRMDMKARVSQLEEQPALSLAGQILTVDLGPGWASAATNMVLHAYRPNNPSQDFSMPLPPHTTRTSIDLSGREFGRWKFSLEWIMNDLRYAWEQELYLDNTP